MLRKIKTVVVNSGTQKGYKYKLTEPVGKNFDPRFKPELTPKEMLELGVFGGQYFVDGGQKEYPKNWFEKAKISQEYDKKLNYFGVLASQPLSVWIEKGWINPQDPRGWFEWYCRYYLGRRTEDDDRQIKRWVAMKRHVSQIKNNCRRGDMECRKKQRQALLHWAYDSRSY